MAEPLQRLPILTVPAWRRISGLEHGFCTRRGGVSGGPWAELNFSFKVGDAPADVERNWDRLRAHVDGRLRFVTMDQVHGARVLEVTAPDAAREEADAMISALPGAGLCVLTADCVPIILVSPQARLAAVVHAGWRGTVANVVVAALIQMLKRSDGRPAEVSAALGPAVGPCCYEVDASIADEIESRWGVMPGAARRYERDRIAKARLDLRAVNTKLLVDAGLDRQAIWQIGGCTACGSSEFFSHRAATAVDAVGRTGRQLSFVGWAE